MVRDCVADCKEKGKIDPLQLNKNYLIYSKTWLYLHFSIISLLNELSQLFLIISKNIISSHLFKTKHKYLIPQNVFTEVWETKTLCCTEDGCNASIRTVSPPTISLIAFIALLTTTIYVMLGGGAGGGGGVDPHHLDPRRLLPWRCCCCCCPAASALCRHSHSHVGPWRERYGATILKQFNKMFWYTQIECGSARTMPPGRCTGRNRKRYSIMLKSTIFVYCVCIKHCNVITNQ